MRSPLSQIHVYLEPDNVTLFGNRVFADVIHVGAPQVAPGVDDGQRSLVCCSPWGVKESDRTQ